jgi:hypothetical protein
MSGTLRLTRETPFAFELRRGVFEIAVDDQSAGSIKLHDTVDTPVEAGRHTLQLRAGRYSSRNLSFEVANGGVASFRCHGALVWPTYVASFLKPDLAISLKPE